MGTGNQMNKTATITRYAIISILTSLVFYGCASAPEKITTINSNDYNAIKKLPKNKSNWQYIRLKNNDALAFDELNPLIDGVYQLNVLEGWLPDGKDIGFGRLAGKRVRSILFMCSEPFFMVGGTVVRDLAHNVIYEQPANGVVSVSRQSDVPIDETIIYVCRNIK